MYHIVPWLLWYNSLEEASTETDFTNEIVPERGAKTSDFDGTEANSVEDSKSNYERKYIAPSTQSSVISRGQFCVQTMSQNAYFLRRRKRRPEPISLPHYVWK
jgi:hypothetical protein